MNEILLAKTKSYAEYHGLPTVFLVTGKLSDSRLRVFCHRAGSPRWNLPELWDPVKDGGIFMSSSGAFDSLNDSQFIYGSIDLDSGLYEVDVYKYYNKED